MGVHSEYLPSQEIAFSGAGDDLELFIFLFEFEAKAF
jgi:hypothetical protein